MNNIIVDTNNWLKPPDTFSDLLQYLDFLKNETKNILNINCNDLINYIVVPHAGIRYSGLCSMSAYLPASNNKNIRNIIILSTDHNENNSKSGIYNKNLIFEDNHKKYKLNINSKINEYLLSYSNLFEEVNLNSEKEHSVFNQIPFIDYLFNDVKVVPIKIGKDNLNQISEIIDSLLDNSFLVVCNTDISHINGHFEHKIYKNIYDTIRLQDSKIIKFLNNENINDIEKLSLCGYNALYLMKKIINNKNLLSKKKLISRTTCYYTSLQLKYFINQDPNISIKINDIVQRFEIKSLLESSVSYVGLVYSFIPDIDNDIDLILSEFEKQSLIAYSYNIGLNHIIKNKRDDLIEPLYSPVYNIKIGTFVTIDNLSFTDMDNKQRGCIGTVNINYNNIKNNIRYFTIQSAFNDTRYKPIILEELAYEIINNNISYFVYKKKILITLIGKKIYVKLHDFINGKTNFKLGKDTVNLNINGKESIYLTKDALIEDNDNELKILKMLCRKGNYYENCLNSQNIKVSYQKSTDFKSNYNILLFDLTYKIFNFKKDLYKYIESNYLKFKYKNIGLLFKKINNYKKNNKKVYLLYGVLWYYIYILECQQPEIVLKKLGYNNCFLFLKQVTQVKMFKLLGKSIIDIVFNKYFIRDLNKDGIPHEMVRDNIAYCCGMIQWIYIGSSDNLNKLITFLNKICLNVSKYPNFLEWRWLDESIEKNDTFKKNHYININGVFNLYYGLYLFDWVKYNIETIKKYSNNLLWLNKFKIFENKLNINNLSLEKFIISLMNIKHKWNPYKNNYIAWLVNHIPYFLSAFYEYDLTEIKKLRNNTGWQSIIEFIRISGPNLKSSSLDYYGECVEILDKLGYDQNKDIKIIQSEIFNLGSRIKILKIDNRPFSDIHTIVTYVMQPNAEDILDTNINKRYGAYIKKIINNMNIKSKQIQTINNMNMNTKSKKNKSKQHESKQTKTKRTKSKQHESKQTKSKQTKSKKTKSKQTKSN